MHNGLDFYSPFELAVGQPIVSEHMAGSDSKLQEPLPCRESRVIDLIGSRSVHAGHFSATPRTRTALLHLNQATPHSSATRVICTSRNSGYFIPDSFPLSFSPSLVDLLNHSHIALEDSVEQRNTGVFSKRSAPLFSNEGPFQEWKETPCSLIGLALHIHPYTIHVPVGPIKVSTLHPIIVQNARDISLLDRTLFQNPNEECPRVLPLDLFPGWGLDGPCTCCDPRARRNLALANLGLSVKCRTPRSSLRWLRFAGMWYCSEILVGAVNFSSLNLAPFIDHSGCPAIRN